MVSIVILKLTMKRNKCDRKNKWLSDQALLFFAPKSYYKLIFPGFNYKQYYDYFLYHFNIQKK